MYVLFLNTRRQQLQKVVSFVVFAATLDYMINYTSIYCTGYCQYIQRVPQNLEKSPTQIRNLIIRHQNCVGDFFQHL